MICSCCQMLYAWHRMDRCSHFEALKCVSTLKTRCQVAADQQSMYFLDTCRSPELAAVTAVLLRPSLLVAHDCEEPLQSISRKLSQTSSQDTKRHRFQFQSALPLGRGLLRNWKASSCRPADCLPPPLLPPGPSRSGTSPAPRSLWDSDAPRLSAGSMESA